jgi:hypothetical protein
MPERDERGERVRCVVTPRVRALDGCYPGEEVILSRDAAIEHARRGRVLVLGPLEPTPATDEEE